MNNLSRIMLNYGKYYRIWPHVDVNRKDLYVSIGLARPFRTPLCKLLLSRDYGESWSEIADFYSLDMRNTTTGQPFVTSEGYILVPVWNARFYTQGQTGIAIYRSREHEMSWEKVFQDPRGTYGNHFFQDPKDSNLYIGIGVGGGGSGGRISFAPAKSYLLKSTDLGRTWRKILKVDYPTSLYSGTTLDNVVFATAREMKSVFRSKDGGVSWTELYVGSTTRSVSYVEELRKLVMTSNSCIFVSDDGLTWARVKSPMKGLILRYPTSYKGKIHMTGVGVGSYIVSTDLKKWYVTFDATKATGSNLFARMAIVNDYVFLGNEMNGTLLRVRLSTDDSRPVNNLQILESYFNYLVFVAKHKIPALNQYEKA